jgi:uncharacterized protein (DUF2126 family)
MSWFAPHLEFRFPKIGEFAVRGIEVDAAQRPRTLACDG